MGGMGAVYKALDRELDMPVALKVIRPDESVGSSPSGSHSLDRFKQELVLARQVTHKNVIRIHDLGEVEGIKYLTMAYVEGTDLACLIKEKGKLEIGQALSFARQIATGLAAAHEAGVVHRDLKPANILIDGDSALITDFGIARSAQGSAIDTAGSIVGTLQYMAPEQARGRPADHRVDIYACGLILYEMLSGWRLIGNTTGRLRVMTDEAVEIPDIDLAQVPDAVAQIVMRCLQPNPDDRFQSASALLVALNELDESGNPLPRLSRIEIPKTWPLVGGKSVSRNAAAAILALAVALPLSSVALFVGTGPTAAPEQHEPVAVVIADLQNLTGDPTLDRTLEPMLKIALEDAGFITAYDRVGITRTLGVQPPENLDEPAALSVALTQGLEVVISGSLNRQGRGYRIAIKATEAVTGNVITSAEDGAATKDDVVGVVAELASRVRQALGDDRPESVQRFATQTFAATSLDVIRQYAAGAEALSTSSFEDALQGFSKTVALDSRFGLGYAGMAIASRNLDRPQDAEKYIKEAVRHLDGMSERERYRTRGLFYYITGDYQACVKEYGDLIARYAADAPARNNLALCLTFLRDLPRAVTEMRQVLNILPNRALYRENLALYAAYSSDFRTAEAVAREMKEPTAYGLEALAFAQLLQDQLPQAVETYEQMGKFNQQAASHTASGLGDLAVYEGRFSAAAQIFTEGAKADLAAEDHDRAAHKFAALAYTELSRQRKEAALAAAEKALANSKTVKIRFLVARVFVGARAIDKARSLAAELASEFLAEPQAYGKIIEGEIALETGDARQAIKHFTEAGTLLDTWVGHFGLARAYLEAGAYTQADSELDRCIARRGEALSIFLDEEPTFGIFPPVYYYQGRVREALENARFAESYRVYLNIRGESKEDPLLRDIQRRIAPAGASAGATTR
jgi:tetratricopeptide (TPR) repeat protein